jgi:hypothetical protein
MLIKWAGVFNRLWPLIDAKGDCYFSGPRFLNAVREVSLDVPPYRQFIEERQSRGKSTSRHDFFYDVLMELDEPTRWRAVNAILGQIDGCAAGDQIYEIRAMLGGTTNAPTATIPPSAWNAERLNGFVAEIDAAIAAGQDERAVSLSYTCLEGFYGAFYRAKNPGQAAPTEIIALSRWIRDYLRSSLAEFPDEVLNLINHTSHAIDRARNRFSESHFGSEAGRWLAVYSRDIVNVQIRLLLHFM